jgi:predicted alpha/beta-hydrolase family hydrolase
MALRFWDSRFIHRTPSDERAKHLVQVKVPMLFLQGTRDALANLELLEP